MRLTALLSMAAKVVAPKDYRYGTNRPWTVAAKRLNPPGKRRRKVFVEPLEAEDWSVVRGDLVRKPRGAYLTHSRLSGWIKKQLSIDSSNVWIYFSCIESV